MLNRLFITRLLLILTAVLVFNLALASVVMAQDETPTAVVTLSPEPDTELPPIEPVIDDYTLDLQDLMNQAAPVLMVVVVAIMVLLKFLLPGQAFETRTIYIWVVVAASVVYGLLTIAGVSDSVPEVLARVNQPAQMLLDLLIIVLGPSGVHFLAETFRTPILGDGMGASAMSLKPR